MDQQEKKAAPLQQKVAEKVDVVEVVRDCGVEPPEVNTIQGGEVAWSGGEHAVKVWFPDHGIFDENPFEIPAGQTKKMTVLHDAPTGAHAYTVFCEGARKFPNAHPIMVIDEGP